MKEVTIVKYQCEICEELYEKKEECLSCEDRPITNDSGAKIGDTVLITNGPGSGELGTVEAKWICSKYWGHYQWERFWHTPIISAKMHTDCGNRSLTWDTYEVKK